MEKIVYQLQIYKGIIMYKCFKICIQLEDLIQIDSQTIDEWKKHGEEVRERLKESVDKIIAKVKDSDGIINGEELTNVWFPTDNYDVFLSYSHDDAELALILAGMLKNTFKLNVFIDQSVWGSADKLLKIIDDEYCKESDGRYNYRDRNFSTSHIHSMLTTSIMKIMDKSEAIFFLNTSNSIYNLKSGFDKKHTLSPWIYEELMLTKLLRETAWSKYRMERSAVINKSATFKESLKIKYPADTDEMKELRYLDIINWEKQWDKRKEENTGCYGSLFLEIDQKILHPLNVLYDLMFK